MSKNHKIRSPLFKYSILLFHFWERLLGKKLLFGLMGLSAVSVILYEWLT